MDQEVFQCKPKQNEWYRKTSSELSLNFKPNNNTFFLLCVLTCTFFYWPHKYPSLSLKHTLTLSPLNAHRSRSSCSYLLVSQSFFQASGDDLLRPKDLSSQQFIPLGHHLQLLPLLVTSIEGLHKPPRGNGLIYSFLKNKNDAFTDCTLSVRSES